MKKIGVLLRGLFFLALAAAVIYFVCVGLILALEYGAYAILHVLNGLLSSQVATGGRTVYQISVNRDNAFAFWTIVVLAAIFGWVVYKALPVFAEMGNGIYNLISYEVKRACAKKKDQ